MSNLSTVGNFLSDIFGFKKNSKYVSNYLNDANIKSSIYMSFIVIVLEIWMIIRNTNKYVITYWNNYSALGYNSNFDLMFSFLGLYVLFIACSAAVLFFSINYLRKKETKTAFIINIILASICILWPVLLCLEHLSFTNSKTIVSSATTLAVYLIMPFLGISIICHSLYRKKYDRKNSALGMVVIIFFAAVCLAFGIKVGYSDFANSFYTTKVVDGVSVESPNFPKLKMITCFFTMVIFVACLLIWKPYISIVLLGTIFIGFMYMLKGYDGREFLDADEINYITFLISLTMVTISIYQQRVTEAQKDEQLIIDAICDHLVDIHNLKYLTDKVSENQINNPIINENKIYLFINIANFRTINDQKGFEEGDKFLRELGENVNIAFRGDLTARQSDDHFVVFTDIYDLDDKIDELEKLVKQSAHGLFVLLKVGGYKPKANEAPNRAIDKARYACGLIKRKFGIRYIEYDDKMDEAFNKRSYIINHIDDAIKNGWIKAYYQPVVWSNTHDLCGAEALARWIDPKYGFLSPADFIPVLEDTRLIHKLDSCIVNYVCSEMRRAIDEGRPVVPVSLNFSRLDFELMDVVKLLEDTVTKYNIDRDYIHVEITESALANNVEYLNEKITSLKELGYAIWLDDFGSGYSSLNVLKDFVFDVIKIDMKFLSNFEHNEKTKDILDAIIQLANRLGMKTLTEGVETEAQSKFLESIGCGRLQGYLFGKPFKLEEFEQKIYDKSFKISDVII